MNSNNIIKRSTWHFSDISMCLKDSWLTQSSFAVVKCRIKSQKICIHCFIEIIMKRLKRREEGYTNYIWKIYIDKGPETSNCAVLRDLFCKLCNRNLSKLVTKEWGGGSRRLSKPANDSDMKLDSSEGSSRALTPAICLYCC